MERATTLVVGATGNVGTELVEQLLQTGHAVRVLARDSRRAAERLGSRVEVVAGDLGDPASLASALRGIETASLATTPSPHLYEQEHNFIRAAREAKLRRLVKLSGFGIDFATDGIHVCHAESETRLRASGVPSVVLRPVAATFARAGKYAMDDDVVQRVLGRRASTFREWVERHRDAFG